MNRFKYASPVLINGETTVAIEYNVRLYDGDLKTSFEGGELIITTTRLIWGRPGAIATGQTCLALNLRQIVYFEEEPQSSFSFSKSRKVILHLGEPTEGDGPQHSSAYTYVKLSFRDGFAGNVLGILADLLQRRLWEPASPVTPENPNPIKLRSGIVGIERSLQEKQKATDVSIDTAFQDLDKLMGMAKDMVRISRMISAKIKEKQGDITEDETIRFKSYLLSLGIEDPVTRDSYKSDNLYYKSLAAELSHYLKPLVEEMGGMMALTDAFCRVNRARSLELVSPEDLLHACKAMDLMELPLTLHQFSSGVTVLQVRSLDDKSIAEATGNLIQDKGSMTPHELSQSLGISLTLAKERLLISERLGKCCRDDAIAGVRFYPNLFLTQEE